MEKIVLDHGTGAKLSHELVDLIVNQLGEVYMGQMEDSAILNIEKENIAMTTDSFVVTPLFFGNGDIGKISICGTVNDLAVSGAIPKYLSLGLIIESGFLISDLIKILNSIREVAIEANIKIVAGDTKVVDSGAADKIFINTSGVGVFHRNPLKTNNITAGDKIILTSNLGDHSIHLLSIREGLGYEQRVKSDCAPLNNMIEDLLCSVEEGTVKVIRDVTRGGFSSVMFEFAHSTGFNMEFEYEKLPISYEVEMACDMLGISPLNLANEGCLCMYVKDGYEQQVLDILKRHDYGKKSVIVGSVSSERNNNVVMLGADNEKKILEELVGAELPRLC
jgi:hydrogenase expression/formation protein HypE